MSRRNPENRKYKRGAGRALLVFLLAALILAALVLGALALAELYEQHSLDDFYSALSQSSGTADDDQEVSLPLLATVLPEATAAPQTSASADQTNEWVPQTTLPPSYLEVESDSSAQAVSEKDFDRLRQTMPDIVGWIRLDDSVIDYPVVHGEDNDYYLSHFPDGTKNRFGSIMMDKANSGNFNDTVNILHGHHMRGGSMFGGLHNYESREYWETHKTIRLMTPAGDYDVAVFAAYTVNGYTFGYHTNFDTEEDFDKFLRRAVTSTPYDTGVEVTFDDRILMLSTCAYSFDGARFIVLGKIQGAVPLDPTPRP